MENPCFHVYTNNHEFDMQVQHSSSGRLTRNMKAALLQDVPMAGKAVLLVSLVLGSIGLVLKDVFTNGQRP